MFKSKIGKLVILAALIISVLANLGLFHCGPGLDEVRNHSDEKLEKHEAIIAGFKTEVNKHKAEKQDLRKSKDELKKIIEDLKNTPVKTPDEVDVVVINNDEYVPKAEYIRVTSLYIALKKGISKYIKLDIEEQDSNDSIIAKLETIDSEREKEIADLKKDRDYFYNKAKKRSFLGIGFGVSVEIRKNDDRYKLGCNLSCGIYYVWKIKFKK